MERGETPDKITGSAENALWYLEQCTGCGRCTEYCLHEIDVAGALRKARKDFYSPTLLPTLPSIGRDKNILFCEPGRQNWWRSRANLLTRMNSPEVIEWTGPHKEWLQGKITSQALASWIDSFSDATNLWFESAEVAWFFLETCEELGRPVAKKVRLVWQEFFKDWASKELSATEVFHESYHLSRLLPRVGVSVPMYERGLLPQHSGWNVIDCGGEGFYREAHPEKANALRERFLNDLKSDGRTATTIISQSLCCVEHLAADKQGSVYWLDHLFPS